MTQININHCINWNNNKSINPTTNRNIKINGPTYKYIERMCYNIVDNFKFSNIQNIQTLGTNYINIIKSLLSKYDQINNRIINKSLIPNKNTENYDQLYQLKINIANKISQNYQNINLFNSTIIIIQEINNFIQNYKYKFHTYEYQNNTNKENINQQSNNDAKIIKNILNNINNNNLINIINNNTDIQNKQITIITIYNIIETNIGNEYNTNNVENVIKYTVQNCLQQENEKYNNHTNYEKLIQEYKKYLLKETDYTSDSIKDNYKFIQTFHPNSLPEKFKNLTELATLIFKNLNNTNFINFQIMQKIVENTIKAFEINSKFNKFNKNTSPIKISREVEEFQEYFINQTEKYATKNILSKKILPSYISSR